MRGIMGINNKEVKTNLDFEFLLNQLKLNKSPSQISKEFNISKQNLNYYLRKLKQEGIIKKVGYGTWEVKNITSNILSKNPKQIRGHAFIWKVKLNKKYDWSKFGNFPLVRNKTPRLILKGRKVWLGKKTIIVYENKSFYGGNSIESRKYAVIGLFEVLGALENKLKINLKPYYFNCTKEHYGMIKNELARQYNRDNEKMYIRDNIEGEWLWIDDSESLGELETKNIVRSKQVQDFWNDNKKHNFKITPSFLMEQQNKNLEMINQVTQNQLMFAKNIETHMQVLKEMNQTLKLIQEKL